MPLKNVSSNLKKSTSGKGFLHQKKNTRHNGWTAKNTQNMDKTRPRHARTLYAKIDTDEHQGKTQLLLYAQDRAYPEKHSASDATRTPEFI